MPGCNKKISIKAIPVTDLDLTIVKNAILAPSSAFKNEQNSILLMKSKILTTRALTFNEARTTYYYEHCSSHATSKLKIRKKLLSIKFPF